MNEEAVPIGPEKAGSKDALAEQDRCAIFEIRDFEAFAAAPQGGYHLNTIKPDEDRLIDRTFGVMRIRGQMKSIIRA